MSWEFGIPEGQCADPDYAYSGTKIVGNDLTFNGCANNNENSNLITSAIDCTGKTNVHLKFHRLLNLSFYSTEIALLEVSNNGQDWDNGALRLMYEYNFSDYNWTEVTYDISSVADNQPTVYIRWCLISGISQVSGWNIDDVYLYEDTPEPTPTPGNYESYILDYSTFITNEYYLEDIATDSNDNIYITGTVEENNLPVTLGAYDSTFNNGRDAFIIKINPNGNGAADLVYSSYFGGNDYEYSESICVGSNGYVYISGYTASDNFPTTINAYQSNIAGNYDIFFSAFSLDGNGAADLIYSTFIGGSDYEDLSDMCMDNQENFYLTGRTTSEGDFPTTLGAYDTSYETYNNECFIIKFKPEFLGGNNISYCTYINNGNDNDGFTNCNGIAVDNNNRIYVTGCTSYSSFPTTLNAICGYNGIWNGFVLCIDPVGNGLNDLKYSSFISGSDKDACNGIAVDDSFVYITGYTLSRFEFPITSNAFDTVHNDSEDAFIIKLNLSGDGNPILVYSTYIGGNNTDIGNSISIIANNIVTITGETKSVNFPVTTGALDESFNGFTDMFIFKLDTGNDNSEGLLYSSYIGGSNHDSGYSIYSNNQRCIYIGGMTLTSNYPITLGAYDTVNNFKKMFVIKITQENSAIPLIGDISNNGSFGFVYIGNQSTPKSYNISGTNILGRITITPPNGFPISQNELGPYVYYPESLTIDCSKKRLNTTIYVIFEPTEDISYSGYITHFYNNQDLGQNIYVSGNLNVPSLKIISILIVLIIFGIYLKIKKI